MNFVRTSSIYSTTAILFAGLMTLALPYPSRAAEAAKKEKLVPHFQPLVANFGKKTTDKVKLLSGPTAVQMLNDKSPGKMWMASLGNVTFKITIQDSTKMQVKDCIDMLEKVPAAYRQAFVVVSETNKAGVAFYADLSGAAAHGSQDYLNMVPRVNACIIVHESGHILEQRVRNAQPDILDKWKAAVEKDKISVSDYGDGANHEDIAEFAFIYALCLDAGSSKLAELRKLSPERYTIWAGILKDAPTIKPPGAPEQTKAASSK